MKDYKRTVERIRELTKDYIVKSNLKSLILGVSGGIDSALVAALLKPVCDELNIPLIGRSITIETNKKEEIERSIQVGENFCTNFEHVDLTSEYLVMKNMVSKSILDTTDVENVHYRKDENSDIIIDEKETEIQRKIRFGNIKARIRMIYLYDLAQKNRGLVLSTDNFTEWFCGFWTLAGDIGDLSVIQQLWKTEVYEMSNWIIENELKTNGEKESLLSCVNATPTDGLGITNSDLDQLGATSYTEVDNYLKSYIYDGVKLPNSEKVVERYEKTHFKRNNPYIFKRDWLNL